MDISLVTAWGREAKEGLYILPHHHDYYELVYYLSGEGCSSVSGTVEAFSAGSFCLLPPQTVHDELHRKAGSLICLGFRTSQPLPVGMYRDRQGRIQAYAHGILQESTQQAPGYQTMLGAQLTALLVDLLRMENRVQKPEPHNFDYVIQYLDAYYPQKIRFSEIAARTGLSYDYFQHRFRQLQGVSPQQFLLRKRLAAAESLLADSCLSCTEIAYRCGFSNSSQFSMLFKRAYGCSPRDYRKA